MKHKGKKTTMMLTHTCTKKKKGLEEEMEEMKKMLKAPK
jgi:hypothetical protein